MSSKDRESTNTAEENPNLLVLKELSKQIRDEYSEYRESYKLKNFKPGLEVGQLLLQVKRTLPDEKFPNWLEDNCPEISERCIRYFIKQATDQEWLKSRPQLNKN